jgi:hypothetical protein
VTPHPGTVTSRRSTRHERRRWPWARYVAVATTPRGYTGQGAHLTRALAERQARADARAAEQRAATARVSNW